MYEGHVGKGLKPAAFSSYGSTAFSLHRPTVHACTSRLHLLLYMLCALAQDFFLAFSLHVAEEHAPADVVRGVALQVVYLKGKL
jgi:hypothetical protein